MPQRASFQEFHIKAKQCFHIEDLKKTLSWRGFQGFLVSHITNVRYLTGFEGSSAWVLLTPIKNIFITDFRYKEEAEGFPYRHDDGWEVFIYKEDIVKAIRKLVESLRIRQLAIESTVTYDFYSSLLKTGIKVRPLRSVVERLRMVKDVEELDLIKESIKRAEAAFNSVLPYIRPGRREREIALRLEEFLKKAGCRRLPFDIIVASGPNSSKPHAKATERALSRGDLLIIDWGGEAGGYFSDMTRTLLLKGEGLSKKIEIYETVLGANKEALKGIAPGIKASNIDRIARGTIKKRGFGEYFGHGTGHGVGLDVHERPSISPRSRDILKEGMVFTIEPGIYIPGLGGVRIEDMVCVTSYGSLVLTGLTKELKII